MLFHQGDMQQLLGFTFCLVAWLQGSLCKVTTVREFSVLEGRSLTVPCHYDPEYTSSVKYWCHGTVRGFCSTLARTDTPLPIPGGFEERARIFDDPVQQVFTVTMRDLKEEETGWYWCGVEIGNMWVADVAASTYITVTHGMFAVNSNVSGEEGSSVTVECSYSQRYRGREKMWCRSRELSSCVATGSDGRYEDAAVAITDDGVGTLAVTLRKLQMPDTGWYLCTTGEQWLPMHVTVTPRPSTTVSWTTSSLATSPLTTQPTPSDPQTATYTREESRDSHRFALEAMLVFTSVTLVMGVLVSARMIWRRYKKEPWVGQAETLSARLHEYPRDQGDPQHAIILLLNKEPRKMDGF